MEAFRPTYPAKLRFYYNFDEKTAEKMGIHPIFHYAKFTYVSANAQETPVLSEIKDGKPSMIAFGFRNGLYSTARVIDPRFILLTAEMTTASIRTSWITEENKRG